MILVYLGVEVIVVKSVYAVEMRFKYELVSIALSSPAISPTQNMAYISRFSLLSGPSSDSYVIES